MACVEVLNPSDTISGLSSARDVPHPLTPPQNPQWTSLSGSTNILVAPIDGWPKSLDSTIAWNGAQLREYTFTHSFSNEEIREIERALSFFKSLKNLSLRHVNQSTFPLPNLSQVLRRLAKELHDGRGFFALRGLKPERYSQEDNAIIYLGISSYVGEQRGNQNDMGHIFGHIRDAKSMEAAQTDRPVRDSTMYSPFHTDSFGDILAMQMRSRPACGGSHLLASSAKIYNELMRTRPDLVRVLATPNWSFDTRGFLTPPSRRALLYYHNGKIIMNLNRDPLLGREGLLRSKDMPTATALQREVLDTVQALAVKYQCVLDIEPGEMIFVNNMSILHAREAFTDSSTEFRYLVRLWLKNDTLAWSLPTELAEGNSRSFSNDFFNQDWNAVYRPRVQFTEAEMMTP